MDVHDSVDLACAPETLRCWVDDLERYPTWLSIVPRAVREDPPVTDAEVEAIGAPAWDIELRAHLGPLARSKRLRMVRTLNDDMHIRFERWELDGKEHSPWVLDARMEVVEDPLAPDLSWPSTTRLSMALHYGGTLGGGLLERLLRDEIDRSKPRLRELVEPASMR